MKDHYEEICAWNAAHTILNLYMEIGLDERYYLDKLAIYLGTEAVSQKAMSLWRHRDRGLPQKYGHTQVMNALDAVIEHYHEDGRIPSSQKAPVLAQWKERREKISKYLKSMIGESVVPAPSERFERWMEARPTGWTLETVFALYSSFDALNSTTRSDLRFWRVLLNTPKEARADKVAVLTRQKVSARRVLDCLYNGEVAHWQDLLNKHKTTQGKTALWERLLEKVDENGCDPLIWGQLLDLLIDSDTGAILGESQLGQDEMALFILFKYCLTENAQDKVLESWA